MMNLEIEVQDLPEGYVVLDHIALIKCLNADGSVVFREHYGKGLSIMEKIGMLDSAHDGLLAWVEKTSRSD